MTAQAIELHSPAALAIRPGQQMWTDKQAAALAALGIKGATKADLAVFMHYCQKTGLDPFSRQIYGIMRRVKGDRQVEGTREPGLHVRPVRLVTDMPIDVAQNGLRVSGPRRLPDGVE